MSVKIEYLSGKINALPVFKCNTCGIEQISGKFPVELVAIVADRIDDFVKDISIPKNIIPEGWKYLDGLHTCEECAKPKQNFSRFFD